MVGHVGFADPFDNMLREIVIKAIENEGVLQGEDINLHQAGTLICMGTNAQLSSHVNAFYLFHDYPEAQFRLQAEI